MKLKIQNLIYTLETLLILLPATLFLIFSAPWLFVGIEFKAWTATFYAFMLWIGGWLGVIALFQILRRLLLIKNSKINYLWIKSAAGTTYVLTSILSVYDLPLRRQDFIGILIFISPIIVGAHWLSVLKISNKKVVQ
jgi:hypothetical protein